MSLVARLHWKRELQRIISGGDIATVLFCLSRSHNIGKHRLAKREVLYLNAVFQLRDFLLISDVILSSYVYGNYAQDFNLCVMYFVIESDKDKVG